MIELCTREQRKKRESGHFRRKQVKGGFALVEAMVATFLVVTVVGALFLADSHILRMLRFQKETVAATHHFQERMEQIRSIGFSQVADAVYLTDPANHIFGLDTKSEGSLQSPLEKATISAYPDISPAATPTPIIITRQGGAVSASKNPNLATQASLLRVDLEFTWNTMNGRERTRRTSTIIGKGNIAP
jgi:hypothetical protein